MTNVLPQAKNMNRGAWFFTEQIIECYRDIDELLVIGGIHNPADDYFLKSHGVATPDAYWKVIIRGSSGQERLIAWIIPNTKDATRKHLDQYLVSIEELEQRTGELFPEVPAFLRSERPEVSGLIPPGGIRK